MKLPATVISPISWIMLAHFEGAFDGDAYWKDMYEVIALDDSDNEIERVEFHNRTMAQECVRQLQKLYGAKLI
jgi:hypothetical protein